MNNNQEESPKIQKNKRQKLRNSKPQEFVLKTFDDMDATIKKKIKKFVIVSYLVKHYK